MFFKSQEDSLVSITGKKYRSRYIEVIKILGKYGLTEFLTPDRFMGAIIKREVKEDESVKKLSRAERARLAIEDLDGAFIKLGQILSNRPDLIPPDFINELEKLQDSVKPFSSEIVVQTIEKELGDSLANLFLMFDMEPLASGSIAQVHRAVLYDGTPVIVKVVRPNIDEKFKIDFDILTYISTRLAKIPALKSQFKNSNPIKELRKEIEKEIDLDNELTNVLVFQENFKDNDKIYVPQVYPEYSTSKVLTMEYVEGIKVIDTAEYEKYDLKPKTVSEDLIELGLDQIFEYRFFHGDPHPGNILILADGKICFIDFGLMGRITSRQKQNILDLIAAFARNDAKTITRIIIKSAPKDMYLDEDQIENEVSFLMDQYYDTSLGDINVGEALYSIVELILSYRITLNYNVYLLIKAVASYEGIGKKVYPEFELSSYAKKYSRRLILREANPVKIAKDMYITTNDAIALVRDLPGELRDLINMVQGGRLRINVGVMDLKETIDYAFDRVEKVVNRLSMTIILAATILGSSLILRGNTTVGANILLVIATVGFVLSMLIVIMILISAVKK